MHIQGVPNSSAHPKGDDRGGPNEQKIVWEEGVYLRLGARRKSLIFGLFTIASKLRVV